MLFARVSLPMRCSSAAPFEPYSGKLSRFMRRIQANPAFPIQKELPDAQDPGSLIRNLSSARNPVRCCRRVFAKDPMRFREACGSTDFNFDDVASLNSRSSHANYSRSPKDIEHSGGNSQAEFCASQPHRQPR